MTPAGAESAVAIGDDAASGVWLLPGFDAYVIAPISHRTQTVPDGYVDRVSRAGAVDLARGRRRRRCAGRLESRTQKTAG